MKRILAVDWGERRVGLALSDELGITAQPLPPLVLASGGAPAATIEAVARLAREHAVGRVVVGLPLLLSGAHGEAAREVERFAQALRATLDVPVELWDERFTSALAEQSLREEGPRGGSGRRKGGGRERTRTVTPADKARIDQRAALLLLQSWLDAHPGRP